MAKADKKEDKVYRFKFDIAISECKRQIDSQIELYEQDMKTTEENAILCLKNEDYFALERHKNHYKMVLVRRLKLENILEQIYKLKFTVEESKVLAEVCNSFKKVITDSTTTKQASKLKRLMKKVFKIEKTFKNDYIRLEKIFNKITESMKDIDNDDYKKNMETKIKIDSQFEDFEKRIESKCELSSGGEVK